MAVIKVVVANGYDELKKIVAESKIRTVIYFSASEDGYGKSWCPDCVSASKPLFSFSSWKDKENPFRKDEHFKLTCIPTLMEYGDKVSVRLRSIYSNIDFFIFLQNGDEKDH
ncbi:unnamed protein product [Dracunculus medinensis]|uniref:Thioredoxin domain-containing protein 17 n=1 Tax=Dracunculus medinensis TaxID=318479 RepID=A0A0N4UN30_DRAME|nr:unnamed protein product [Dracunculus medinensis]